MMKIYGVIGDPIEHSMSPLMQNAVFRAAGIDAKYCRFKVKPGELQNTIKGVKALGIAGVNVTIPHKIEVMKYLDELDPLAKDIGAVNTILNKDGKLIGYNTDGYGALESLREATDTENKEISILGAGGAARAIAFTLAREGKIKQITIMNRDQVKAKNLAKEITEKTKANVSGTGLENDELRAQLQKTDIVINCTPVGMHPKTDESPVPILHKGMIVFDIVYNPLKTKLVEDAEKTGCRVITGENMLVLQGAKAFEIWTGKKPDVRLMHAVVMGKLQPSEARNIVLLGFMGTGKTVTGELLAKILDMEFIDIDHEIEKMAGIDIPNIFEKHGEKRFRELEMEAIELHSQRGGAVISCGGGAVLNYLNMMRLKENSDMFLLKASPKVLVERLKSEKNRPLLGLEDKEKEARINMILEARESFYSAAGAVEINTDGKTPQQVADEIMKDRRGKNE
jgi:shikimate dehydrogenase